MRRARKPGRPAQVRRASARINEQIGDRRVRLVADDGGQLRVMAAADARAYAYERGLDLVEVAATSEPPVCRVMDYGKWRYEGAQAAAEPPQPGARLAEGGSVAPQDRGARLRVEAEPGTRLPRRRVEGEGDRVLPRPGAGASGTRAGADRSPRGRHRRAGTPR